MRTDVLDVGNHFGRGFRYLPARWTCAVLARRPTAMLTIGAACVVVTLAIVRSGDSDDAKELGFMFGATIGLSALAHYLFVRKVRQYESELESVARGFTPGEPAIQEKEMKRGRNPRSADFLSQGTPASQLAADVTAVILWMLLVVLSRSSDHSLKIFVAALVALVAFERVGHYQVLSALRNSVARMRREARNRPSGSVRYGHAPTRIEPAKKTV